jgi:hypothetical protein
MVMDGANKVVNYSLFGKMDTTFFKSLQCCYNV